MNDFIGLLIESIYISRRAAARNVTGRTVNPRSPKFSRHVIGPGPSDKSLNRRNRVENAICASMRASGAPKQKCAPQPKAT
jgi:hypothetical protein